MEGDAAVNGGEETPSAANVATEALASAVADMAVQHSPTGAEASQATAAVAALKYANVGVKNQADLLADDLVFLLMCRPVQQARAYQMELLDAAVEDNVITFLETGAGKTFIAVLLIKVSHESC